MAFGLFNRKHDHLLLNTIVGVALLIVCIAVGIYCPIYFSKKLWMVVVFAYIFIASVAPVWILLQSRDYLNSFLLYFMIAAAVIGVVFTNRRREFSLCHQERESCHAEIRQHPSICYQTLAALCRGALSGAAG